MAGAASIDILRSLALSRADFQKYLVELGFVTQSFMFISKLRILSMGLSQLRGSDFAQPAYTSIRSSVTCSVAEEAPIQIRSNVVSIVPLTLAWHRPPPLLLPPSPKVGTFLMGKSPWPFRLMAISAWVGVPRLFGSNADQVGHVVAFVVAPLFVGEGWGTGA